MGRTTEAAGATERKEAAPADIISTDDQTGIVEAIVSITGVVDEQGDIIQPGTYKETLAKRKPKGVFSHDWNRWTARTEDIRELTPGDELLPSKTATGQPWPADAGGLWVRHRYNLNTQEGRDAYENVKFFSETGECAWSIGYSVPKGGAVRGKDGIRRISRLDLFEYSPVLHGAAPLATTLSVKTRQDHQDGGQDDVAQLHAATEGDIDWDEVERAAPGDPEGGKAAPGGFVDPEDGDQDDGGGDDASASGVSGPDSPGEKDAPGAGDQDEDYSTDGDADTLAAMAGDDQFDGDVGTRDAMGGGVKKAHSSDQRRRAARRGHALPDGSYPIEDGGDLDSAVRVFPRGFGKNGKTKDQIRRHIVRRARAMGLTHRLPDSWPESGSGKKTLDVDEVHQLIDQLAAAAGMKATGGADRNRDALGYYPATHAARQKSAAAMETKSRDELPGSFEEQRDLIRRAVDRLFGASDTPQNDGTPSPWASIVGTYPDRVVVNVYSGGASMEQRAYEVGYSVDADGQVELDEPVPVEIRLTVDGGQESQAAEADMLSLARMLEDAAGIASALDAAQGSKAGRVLSAGNATKVRDAVRRLIDVLTAAGVPLDNEGGGKKNDAPGEAGDGGVRQLPRADITQLLEQFKAASK